MIIYSSELECAGFLLDGREGWVMRCVMMLTAGIVATVTMGTAVAPAAHYPRKLAPPWPQLAQTTETPRDETGSWAPAEVTTAVLEQHDAVLGRQVRSLLERIWGGSSTWSLIRAGRCVLRSSTLGLPGGWQPQDRG